MNKWFDSRDSRREVPHIFYSGDFNLNLGKHLTFGHPNDLVSYYAREVNIHAGPYCKELRYRAVHANGQRFRLDKKRLVVDHNCG